jgi:hypothetical protein
VRAVGGLRGGVGGRELILGIETSCDDTGAAVVMHRSSRAFALRSEAHGFGNMLNSCSGGACEQD